MLKGYDCLTGVSNYEIKCVTFIVIIDRENKRAEHWTGWHGD